MVGVGVVEENFLSEEGKRCLNAPAVSEALSQLSFDANSQHSM